MHTKLAVIFKYDSLNNRYLCDDITIAMVDENDNFRIEVGDYTGYDEHTLKRIIDDEDNDILKSNEVEIINDYKRYAVYIFENETIKELTKMVTDNFKINTFSYIRGFMEKVELININDNKYRINKNKEVVSNVSLSDLYSVKNLWMEDNENLVANNKIELEEIPNKELEEEKEIKKFKPDLNIDLFKVCKFVPPKLVDNGELFSLMNEVEKNTNTGFNSDIDVMEVINSISKKIVGQEEAIKTIVTNIYYNQKLIDSLNDSDINELESRKVSILLDGPTGTGKTAILKEIAEKFSLPITIVNANSFSETGYVGPTITDTLKNLLKMTGGDVELAERGIIVLDEVDKLASTPNPNGKDSKKIVQEELLGFISGGTYNVDLGKPPLLNSKEMSTNKITFILSGAFTNLRENKIKEINSHSIGFGGKEEQKDNTYIIDAEDYIDYGLLREFFGRIKVLTNTKGYTQEDLKNILLNSEISPLKNFEKTVKLFGYNGIKYSDEFIDRLCEEAYNHNTGARALQTYMSGIQNIMLQDLITKKYEGDEVILDENLIDSYDNKKVRSF